MFYFAYLQNRTLAESFAITVLPFLLGEGLKIFIAGILGIRIRLRLILDTGFTDRGKRA